MDEDDPIDLDDLSNEELEQFLEAEQSELDALVEADGQSPVLEQWSERVENFGGRLGSPGASRPILKSLGNAKLGSTVALDTTAASNADFPSRINLCEMSLPRPIGVDLNFSYPNIDLEQGFLASLDTGDGFCEITWGVTQAENRRVLVDGSRGWRFPFSCSYLRLDYIPIQKNGERPINTSQAADLQISGMISPASGAPCLPLTKTTFYPDILGVGTSIKIVPTFAKNVTLQFASPNDNPNFTANFNQAIFGFSVGAFYANGNASQWPTWSGYRTYPVPQRSTTLRLTANNNQTDLISPVAIYELAL